MAGFNRDARDRIRRTVRRSEQALDPRYRLKQRRDPILQGDTALRWSRAISRSTAVASETIPASGNDPQKTRSKVFTAELVRREEVDATTFDLIPTGEMVSVLNEFPDDMPDDQELLVLEMPGDEPWTIAVWFCDSEESGGA